MHPIEEFKQLAIEANHKLLSEGSCGDADLEPFCLRIVDIATRHPEFRTELVDGFKNIVRDRDAGAWEIILLCMHILRWPEIMNWAKGRHEECVATDDWRGEPVYRAILEAFEDNWPDDGIYACLNSNAEQ